MKWKGNKIQYTWNYSKQNQAKIYQYKTPFVPVGYHSLPYGQHHLRTWNLFYLVGCHQLVFFSKVSHVIKLSTFHFTEFYLKKILQLERVCCPFLLQTFYFITTWLFWHVKLFKLRYYKLICSKFESPDTCTGWKTKSKKASLESTDHVAHNSLFEGKQKQVKRKNKLHITIV